MLVYMYPYNGILPILTRHEVSKTKSQSNFPKTPSKFYILFYGHWQTKARNPKVINYVTLLIGLDCVNLN